MKKYVCIAMVFAKVGCFVADDSMGQSIEYTYDAAGNHIKRHYNPPPPPPLVAQKFVIIQDKLAIDITDTLKANAIATSGNFSLQLKQPLTNASVNIFDVSGRTLIRNIANGNKLKYNLNMYPPGVYFLKIYEKGRPLVIKILKH